MAKLPTKLVEIVLCHIVGHFGFRLAEFPPPIRPRDFRADFQPIRMVNFAMGEGLSRESMLGLSQEISVIALPALRPDQIPNIRELGSILNTCLWRYYDD